MFSIKRIDVLKIFQCHKMAVDTLNRHLQNHYLGFSLRGLIYGTNVPLMAAPKGHFDHTVEIIGDIY